MIQILVVEDDFLIALMIRTTLENLGHNVCGVARNVQDAIFLARKEQPDLIVADFRLDGPGTGVDAVRAIRSEQPVRVIYLTGNADEVRAEDPTASILEKPFDPATLATTIDRVLAQT